MTHTDESTIYRDESRTQTSESETHSDKFVTFIDESRIQSNKSATHPDDFVTKQYHFIEKAENIAHILHIPELRGHFGPDNGSVGEVADAAQ